jgi:hypothetical protein
LAPRRAAPIKTGLEPRKPRPSTADANLGTLADPDLIEPHFATHLPPMIPTLPRLRLAKPKPQAREEAVQVTRGNRSWSGSWTVEHGRIVVTSAYGFRTADAGKERGQAARAARLLAEIVDARVRP